MASAKAETHQLPDLEANTNIGNELEMAQYQGDDHSQEKSDMMNALIIDGNSAEDLASEGTDEYMESQPEQQFLTIAQGNNQITVNDSGSMVYTDASFIDTMTDQLSPKDADPAIGSEYYQEDSDGLEPQYLQESTEMIDQDNVEESIDTGLILSQNNTAPTQVVSQSLLQHVSQSSGPITINAGTMLSRELKNFVTIQSEPRGIKRPFQAGPSKNVVTKVLVQSASKSGSGQRSMGRTMTLAEAQRLGLISQRGTLQQVLCSTGGSPGRVIMKRMIPSSGSSVLVKSPTKILPAPGPRERITFAGMRNTVPVSHTIRTSLPSSQLKTFLSTGNIQARPVTLTKSLGGTITRVEGRVPQKMYVRPANVLTTQAGQLRIPVQIAGKQQVQYVKLINNSGGSGSGVSFTAVKPKMVQTLVARSIAPSPVVQKLTDAVPVKRNIIYNVSDAEKIPVTTLQIKSNNGVPLTYKGKALTTKEVAAREEISESTDDDAEDSGPIPDSEEVDKEVDDTEETRADSPQQLLEANGIRPKKPCNCTRSQCLKLYCECFANGEFCFQCNCNNCFNNIDHEEERQLSIKSCLERNPSAFRPKIHVADSDEEERRHNKGCNCKRSHCLKNYCECFEAKLTCGKYCKCMSCKNTEEEMALWIRGEGRDADDSGEEDKEGMKGTPFMPQPLAEALCQCILVQAEAAERKGEDAVTTEQRIIEELGQRLVQIIGNRSKRDSR